MAQESTAYIVRKAPPQEGLEIFEHNFVLLESMCPSELDPYVYKAAAGSCWQLPAPELSKIRPEHVFEPIAVTTGIITNASATSVHWWWL